MEACVPVQLGRDCSLDPNVILGYPPGRSIERTPVVIGDNARIRSGSVVYASVQIGSGFETGHGIIIREGTRIGNDCMVWNHTTIDYDCVLGDEVRIHCNVYIAQYTTIENNVFLAPGVLLANDPHPICTKCMQGPTVRSGARVGMGAVILPHVVIGERSLVGAGSVVTNDVPAFAVVAGSPARIVGNVNDLECPFDILKPYVNGMDVRHRDEWASVPSLERPILRPAPGKR